MSPTVEGQPVALRAQGAGPTVLLLHGNPDTKEVWDGVLAALADAPLRCVAPDLPGFGDTPPHAGPERTLARFGAWTAALVEQLTPEPLHLVVHDVGGFYGLPFVCEHPERVASLLILNTPFQAAFRWHRWGKAWRTPLLGELVMALSTRWIFTHELRRGSKGYPVADARAAFARVTPATKREVLKLYRAIDPEVFAPWEPRLAAAAEQVPTRVLWGERDPYIDRALADRFGTTSVERIPDVGHWVQVERPDLVAATVRELSGV